MMTRFNSFAIAAIVLSMSASVSITSVASEPMTLKGLEWRLVGP